MQLTKSYRQGICVLDQERDVRDALTLFLMTSRMVGEGVPVRPPVLLMEWDPVGRSGFMSRPKCNYRMYWCPNQDFEMRCLTSARCQWKEGETMLSDDEIEEKVSQVIELLKEIEQEYHQREDPQNMAIYRGSRMVLEAKDNIPGMLKSSIFG